jgi:putative ABC transport system permease protein
MFRSYLKVAVRNLSKNKVFSLINIVGLSLGMASSLLIFLWVKDELSMDNFHANESAIYNVYERVFSEGKVEAGNGTPGLLATELKRTIPEIKYASSFDGRQAGTFEVGAKIITLQGAAADSDFFKIFTYKLLQGTAASALAGPDKIAVSRKMAESFFGSAEAAMNQPIRFNNSLSFTISAVFENLPANSSDQFDFVENWKFHLESVNWLKEWIYRSPKTYVMLRPETDPVKLESKIKNFLSAYIQGKDGSGFHLELGLQPFDEMYLHATFKEGRQSGGRIEYVHLFSIVAVFILLIACINFMNLSTARSVKRAKEVGIRKTVGAHRFGLIIQFIGEALWLSFLALIIAVLFVLFMLPVFNGITGKQIELPLSQPSFWWAMITLILAMGLVSGSYPAFFLSSLKAVKVLKGTLKFSISALWFRKGLVILQFGLSIILIIGTLVVSKQINYVQTENLGFDRENLIYVPLQGGLTNKYPVFKQEILEMPGIKAVTRTDQEPTETGAHAYDMEWSGKNPSTKTVVIHTTVGYGFLKTLNLKLLQGRDFSRDFATDTAAYIINETALKLIGYKNPIGQPLSIFKSRWKIIGVVKDFHFKSLHDPIEPLLINLNENINWGYALVRTEPGRTKEAIAGLEKVCKQLEPKFPFSYSFSDDQYQRLYRSEQIVGRLSTGFAGLAIFISCLGLLGLAMFTAEQRTKEIGIRKVLGATEANIFQLLSADFLRLVAISFIVASPIAWLLMNAWLEDYAYRTNISWWIFIVAGFLTLTVALITVSFQAIKAAIANPVKSLRTE